MKIVSITGSLSSIGKTYVACKLLNSLPAWGALKVTRCFDGACPRGTECSVCESLKTNFDVIDDPEIILQPDTDTWKLQQACTEKIIWVKTHPDFLKEAVMSALAYFNKLSGIIVEGNSFLEIYDSDYSIMVIDGTHKYKPSAKRILNKIDLFLLRRLDHAISEETENLIKNRPYIFLPDEDKNDLLWVEDIIGRIKSA